MGNHGSYHFETAPMSASRPLQDSMAPGYPVCVLDGGTRIYRLYPRAVPCRETPCDADLRVVAGPEPAPPTAPRRRLVLTAALLVAYGAAFGAAWLLVQGV